MNAKHLRIGLYGGGFDPIHVAHLILAQTAIESLDLDSVIFMPSGGQAHYKDASNIASGVDRVEMARLATASNPRMEVSSFEAERDHFTCTIDTLRHLRNQYPQETEIFLLVGGDWKDNMSSWKDGDALMREFNVVVFPRPGFDRNDRDQDSSQPLIQYIEMPQIELSSTTIRNRIKQGLPIDYMVPGNVKDYIAKQRLYK